MTWAAPRSRRRKTVQFLICIALLVVACTTMLRWPRAGGAPAEPAATEQLFDGKSLEGWVTRDGNPPAKGWAVEDGCIVRSGHGGGDLLTRDAYEDFDLAFEFKITAGVNSGLKYRVRRYGDELLGPEYQILDESDGPAKPGSETGSLYALYETSPDRSLKPPGQWNHARIVARGSRIEHWLNDVKLLEADTASDDWSARLAKSKFARRTGFATGPGRIMLTDHAPKAGAAEDKVWFRNVTLRRLAPGTD